MGNGQVFYRTVFWLVALFYIVAVCSGFYFLMKYRQRFFK